MRGVLPFVFPGMAAGLVLAGMHTYLGIQIVERRLIFAGLMLAQLAALGSTVAVFAGYELHGPVSGFFSVVLTTIGAAALVLIPTRRSSDVPKEAIVAIFYVAAAATTALLSSTAPHPRPSSILTVSLHTVLKTAVLYAVIGCVYYVFRNQLASQTRSWDFVLYALIGVVVVPAVAIAGVLLVFAYLIVPPVVAMRLSSGSGTRLAIGWAAGALLSATAILIAFKADLPTGATVVGTFGLTLGVMALVWLLRRKRRSPIANS